MFDSTRVKLYTNEIKVMAKQMLAVLFDEELMDKSKRDNREALLRGPIVKWVCGQFLNDTDSESLWVGMVANIPWTKCSRVQISGP